MKSRKGKTVAKADLPQKDCAGCGHPFVWRKKWEKVWDEVRYCSDRCRRKTKAAGRIPVQPVVRKPIGEVE